MGEQTTSVDVAYPEAEELRLRITVGACRVTVTRGAEAWVEGTYHDPSGTIPIVVESDGGSVRIKQRPDVESIVGILKGAPRLELRLGTARPFALAVEGGANDADLELGGIPLSELEVRHGAGQVVVHFSEPNPVEMSKMRLTTGAGTLTATGLAHAGFGQLVAEGGAAKFELDFGGELRRPATATVSTGAASVEIRIPSGTAAKVSSKTVLGSVEVGSGFATHDGEYWTGAAEDGTSPALSVEATVAVGAFRLSTT